MKVLTRIFLILTIIAGLACVAIGLLVIKPAKEKLEADLKTANDTAATEKRDKEDALVKLDKTTKDLTSTKSELATTKTDLEKSKTDLADRENKIKEVQLTLETTNKDLEAKKADLKKILDGLPEGVAIDQVSVKFKEFQDNLTTLDQEKKILTEQLTKLTADKKKLQDYIQNKKDGVMPAGLTGHILAINKDWNFVVLDIGQNQGVIEKLPMMVHRSGNLIGKVMITSVEPSIAIADVMSDWKKEDFQEGDLVSF
jgi:hypothetical protein